MSSNDPRAGPSTPSGDEPRDELARWLSQDSAAPPELGSLYADVQGQLAHERGPRAWLRALSTPARAALSGALLLLAVLGTALFSLRPDLSVYPHGRMALTLLFSAALAFAQLWLVLRPLQRPAVPAWLAPALILGAFGGLLGLYLLPVAHVAHPASVQEPGLGALLERARPCLAAGLLLASAIYALLRALDRGGAGHALLAATCGGVSANLLLQLHCPVTAPAHLLLGHLGAGLAFTAGVALWAGTSRRAT